MFLDPLNLLDMMTIELYDYYHVFTFSQFLLGRSNKLQTLLLMVLI